ncbi:MAG: heat-inducible transcriptional repressor HrcA [Alphaproteobacteria bacterium]|nr:heat-inducible transcriptional repressor HrcA [Alphaproteobacteria bacterium]
MLESLDTRQKEIFRLLVDTWLGAGDPVGSRALERLLDHRLSAATIRNVMMDLEEMGLLRSPHTSAGRLPTQTGLRMYIDGLLEINPLQDQERKKIEAACLSSGTAPADVLSRTSSLLSGLSDWVGLVVAPKSNKPMRQLQFIRIEPKQVLLALVFEDGSVENRLMQMKEDVSPSVLEQASNFLNSFVSGKTLAEVHDELTLQIKAQKTVLNSLVQKLVEQGIAVATPEALNDAGHLIIRGTSRLLEDVKAMEQLDRARQLLQALENQETVSYLLGEAGQADGVQIYVGTESRMFNDSGWSMVLSPYKSAGGKIVGAIGVIGPNRLDYGKIIPIVDYTSQIMARMLSTK